MINRKFKYIITTILLSLFVLSGCTNERQENEDAYRQIGINSMEEGDYAGAVTAFERALAQCIGKIGPEEIDISYYKAAAQYASGDAEGAIATYTAVIDYDKKAADAYYQRGCLYLKQGNNDEAKTDYQNAIKYNADDYELYINIYENLSSYDMAADGEEYLNKAFDIKGSEAENMAYRGQIYYLLGQYDNAVTELNAAIEKESAIAYLTMAQVYDAQGDPATAEGYYQAYVASGAADTQALNALAEIQIAKADYAGAITYLQQAMEMENITNQRALMQNLIIAYEYTGDFAAAWNVVQEYVELYPEDANAQREYTFLQNRQMPTETEAVEPESTETDTEQDTEGVVSTEDTEN